GTTGLDRVRGLSPPGHLRPSPRRRTLPTVPIRGLLFDFDGLIVDTESTAFASWQRVYREHGHELPLDRWVTIIGTIGGFEPLDHLEELVGSPFDRGAAGARQRAHEVLLSEAEALRPGV